MSYFFVGQNFPIPLSQLDQSGATAGEFIAWNGTSWAPSSFIPGSGTVTSVGLTAPSALFVSPVSGSPVTTAGTLALALATQAANLVFRSGAGGTPSFGALTSADLPAGTGTVTSVNITEGTVFSTPSNTVTTSGSLALTLLTQSANTFFAGPVSGGSVAPTWRALVAGDVPTLNQNTTGTAANVTATSNSTLTTLSALSLPFSQLSGTATAGQIPSTLNSTTFNSSVTLSNTGSLTWGTQSILSSPGTGQYLLAFPGAPNGAQPVTLFFNNATSGGGSYGGIQWAPGYFALLGNETGGYQHWVCTGYNVQPGKTAATITTGLYSTSSTSLGIACNSLAGLVFDGSVNATFGANIISGGTITAPSASTVGWTSRSNLSSPADGQLLVAFNNGTTNTNASVTFGTTGTSGLMLVNNGSQGLQLRDGTNSNYRGFFAQSFGANSTASAVYNLIGSSSYGLGFSDSTHTTLYSNGVAALNFDSSQNGTFGANVLLPTTAALQWTTASSQVQNVSDGVILVTNHVGTYVSTGNGIVLGAATTAGAGIFSLTLGGNPGIAFKNGTQAAYCSMAGATFYAGTTAAAAFANVNAGGYGFGFNDSTHTTIYANSAIAMTFDSSQRVSGFKWLPVAKTANYTILTTDSGSRFTNAGAAGSVQFTLPTPATGLTFTFTCIAAQTMTVVTPSGSIFQAALTGSTRTFSGGTTGLNASATYTCLDGTNWYTEGSSGTVT